MYRFFLTETPREGTVVFGRDESHKIGRVLRLRPGDRITGVLPPDRELSIELVSVGPAGTEGRVIGEERVKREPPLSVWLFQGLPKGEKMDLILQKATELGVERVVPVETGRAVTRIDPSRRDGRVARWERIAREAAQQSGRTRIPEVSGPVGFSEALGTAGRDALRLIAWEKQEGRTLKEVLKERGNPPAVDLFVGPEGGFEEDEVSAAVRAGFVSVSLGPRILRTETAGPALLAIIMYELGDLR